MRAEDHPLFTLFLCHGSLRKDKLYECRKRGKVGNKNVGAGSLKSIELLFVPAETFPFVGSHPYGEGSGFLSHANFNRTISYDNQLVGLQFLSVSSLCITFFFEYSSKLLKAP